ncbi:hypothetical protein HJC23_009562 [Cyclotella cryptica]|uniref:P-type ATPase A domain-containing protein n=1 Tax=Cyclotella cryptica TaxID=29204 RepID=A0ABD3PHU6_9STRA
MIHTKIFIGLLLCFVEAHGGIFPRSSSMLSLTCGVRTRMSDHRQNGHRKHAKRSVVHDIRGGASAVAFNTNTTDSSLTITEKLIASNAKDGELDENSHNGRTADSIFNGQQTNDTLQRKTSTSTTVTIPPNNMHIHIEAILLPRQTSILKPLRFASFLLMNMSFNLCMQTAGKPMEDAVRRVLRMPLDDSDTFASKVTPLHVYVAKKLLSSSSSSSSTSVEMLPPAHLPAPLPLLGLFLSILLYVGGTVLAPKWSVRAESFLNYERLDLNREDGDAIVHASDRLWNWFEQQKYDDVDAYYQSATKKLSYPAVLVNDMNNESKGTAAKGTICQLYVSPENDENTEQQVSSNTLRNHYLDHPRRYYFEYTGKRYYFDLIYQADFEPKTPALISGSPNLHELPICKLLSEDYNCGLCTESKLSRARARYGSYSHISIPIPTLTSAFVSRMTSPLVALQLVGRLLSVLEDESIGKSLANLARLTFQHVSDAKRSIETATILANEVRENEDLGEKGSGARIWAVRPKADILTQASKSKRMGKARKGNTTREAVEWVEIQPLDLLPGDVFIISSAAGNISYFASAVTVPVDALLLDGTCVTEEAALTGESVPQAKVPLELSLEDYEEGNQLDMNGHHRCSCLFSGTKLLQCSNDQVATNDDTGLYQSLPPLPKDLRLPEDNLPALFLTLRSGSYSSRGQIIQSLVNSKADLGALSNPASEVDSLRLIGVLSVVAIGACIYLLIDDTSDRHADSIFKRIVQCTRVAVASVPSDLPVALSASARECAAVLREETDAICSDPGALLEASKVDCIVFDKTGTLTADTQSLVSVLHPPREQELGLNMAGIVLAGCHSIIGMNETLVGDPLDKACLEFSGWKYDPKRNVATLGASKVWQIRSFPFDSNRKMSSAIILARDGQGKFRLLVVLKGAPNKLQSLFDNESYRWYSSEVRRLGEIGYRSIALGTLDASDTVVEEQLFPSGLPQHDQPIEIVEHMVQGARSHARKIHRNDVECYPSDILEGKSFVMVGLASFDAPMRASTSRVVNELKKANIQLKMLTGDEVSTSLSVARTAGMIDKQESQNIHVLKLDHSGSLVWECNKDLSEFNRTTANKVYHDIICRNGIFVAQGNAVRAILGNRGKAADFVRQEVLPHATMIVSASPDEKHIFVKWLQHACGKHVLMCGDGVNDIAAMTDADVSVAMMSGFGCEAPREDNVKDVDDMVRLERLKRRRIGSNRISSIRAKPASEEEYMGIGDTPVAVSARIQQRISQGLCRLKNQQTNTSSSSPLSVILSSVTEEFHRFRKLKRGGSAAAKILAEEDRLRQSLQRKAKVDGTPDGPTRSSDEISDIKTGEACLASSFTLLRPSVSGVETIVRSGIAAACSNLSIYRKIALNCILSCYNLATLYKNGLRYGKYMWQCELAGIIYSDRASFTASSTPRPRIVADMRPSSSPFHPAEIFSVACQAVIHIVILTQAVSDGKSLESLHPKGVQHGFRIKWASTGKEGTPSVGAVLASLVDTPASTVASSDSHDATTPQQSFFRRSPFQPNHVSNNVFLVSVFQNAVMALVNHPGRPFSMAFLESQPLCLSVALSFLLCFVCIAETFPLLNRCLQLAPFPTKASKVAILRLLLLDVALNYFVEYICTFLFRHDVWMARNEPSSLLRHRGHMNAADEEDKLLNEERVRNVSILYVLSVFGCSILLPLIIS